MTMMTTTVLTAARGASRQLAAATRARAPTARVNVYSVRFAAAAAPEGTPRRVITNANAPVRVVTEFPSLGKRRCWDKAEVERCVREIISLIAFNGENKPFDFYANFATDLKLSESQVRRIHKAAHIAFDVHFRPVPGLFDYDRFCFSPAELADVMAAELDSVLRLS